MNKPSRSPHYSRSLFTTVRRAVNTGARVLGVTTLITAFALSPLAGLSTQVAFAEPPADGIYGNIVDRAENYVEGANVLLSCDGETWSNFATSDENGDYHVAMADITSILSTANCDDGDMITMRAEKTGYTQFHGGWTGLEVDLFDGEGTMPLGDWVSIEFNDAKEANYTLESNAPPVDPLTFATTTNKTGTSGVAVDIEDIVITGGEGTDVLDLNLYATGGTFNYTSQGGVTAAATTTNVQFRGTREDLNATLQTLTFTSANSGQFRVEARLGGQNGEIYNPENEHVYQIVAGSLTWSAAKAAAEAMKYPDEDGVPGYLATITTPKEHSIIVDRISGDGWIGANDIAQEGTWRWVTGPEAGYQFWQGAGTSTGGIAANGMFANWAVNEPNNAGANGEDCAEFRNSAGGRWNDIPCDNPRPYYVVEFGTDDALPEVIVTSFTVTVDLMRGNEILSCGVVIDTAGEYVLDQNLTLGTFQEDCITITADNVSLDGNGFTISGHANTGDESAVFAEDVDTLSVTGLSTYGFYDAFDIKGSENVVIENNTANDSADEGIDVDNSTNVIIRGNTISGAGGDGITISESEILLIESNILQEIRDEGIDIDATEEFVIKNNTITSNENGIEIDGAGHQSSNNLVIDNTITSGEWSIYFGDVANTEVLNNRIQSDQWIYNGGEGASQNIFHKDGKGNRYYFANGDGAWTVFDIKDTNRDNWADTGNSLPFNESLILSSDVISDNKGVFPTSPSYVERQSSFEGDTESMFDGNDSGEGLVIEDGAEFASFHYANEFPDPVANVKWHVVHNGGTSVIEIPQGCYLNDGKLFGLMIDAGANGDLLFRCAEEISEGMLGLDGFGENQLVATPVTIYESWLTYGSGGQALWEGTGQDAHPWTETVSGGGGSGGSSGGGSRGGTRSPATPAQPGVTTPTTPTAVPAAVANVITQNRALFIAARDAGITLPAFILNLLGLGGEAPAGGLCPRYTFTRDLQFGDQGEDVRALQRFFNCAGFALGTSGPGAPGEETPYFVERTRTSLIKFQEQYAADVLAPINRTQGTGIFSSYSRAKVQSLMAQ